MSFLYKLIFDVSLYYVFATYIYSLFSRAKPSFCCYILIAFLIIMRSIIEKKASQKSKVFRLFYVIPIAAVFLRASVFDFLLMLPPWAYIIICFERRLLYNDIERVRNIFSLGLKLMLIFVIGFVYPAGRKAFTQAIPYIVLFLFFGVCLLRMLREEKESSLRQLIALSFFLVICGLLTLGQAPQILLAALGLLYKYVISYIFLAICFIFIGIFWILGKLFSLISKKTPTFNELPTITADSAAELLGIEDDMVTRTSPEWIKILMICIAAVIIVLIVFIVFKKLAGNSIVLKSNDYFEMVEAISSSPKKKKGNTIYRKNIRDRIIHTFILILNESEKKQIIKRELSETAGEISTKIASEISDINIESCLYAFSAARYSETTVLYREMLEDEEKVLKAVKKFNYKKM